MPLDVGVGILLGLLLSPFGHNTALNVIVAVAFVLLPDLDALIYYGSKFSHVGKLERKAADHRSLLHYPLVYILVGSVIISLLNIKLLPLFVLASLAHFLHDSVGTGWGIPWLLPLNKYRIKFLYQYDLRQAKQPQKFMWAWTENEQKDLMIRFGDPDWHKHTFQFWSYATVWSSFEFLVLIFALLILVMHSY